MCLSFLIHEMSAVVWVVEIVYVKTLSKCQL